MSSNDVSNLDIFVVAHSHTPTIKEVYACSREDVSFEENCVVTRCSTFGEAKTLLDSYIAKGYILNRVGKSKVNKTIESLGE